MHPPPILAMDTICAEIELFGANDTFHGAMLAVPITGESLYWNPDIALVEAALPVAPLWGHY